MNDLRSHAVNRIVLAFLILILISPRSVAQKTTDAQLEEYKQQVEQNQSNGNLNEAAKYLNKIAYAYWDRQALDQTIEYFNKSLQVSEKIGNKNSIATIYSNLGVIESDRKNNQEALSYFEKSYAVRKEMKDKQGQASQLINIGMVQQNLKNHAEAIEKLEEALSLAKELSNVGLMKNCYSLLAESYDKTGNSAKSFEYFNYFRALEKKDEKEEIKKTKEEIDKLSQKNQQSEQLRREEEKQLAEEDEKLKTVEEVAKAREEVNEEKTKEIDLLEKDKELKEEFIHEKDAEIESEKHTIYLIFASSILLAGLAFVSFINFKQKAKANKLLHLQAEEIKAKSAELEKAVEEIKGQNLKITASITTAQRIQEAMLPDSATLKTHFPQSFIFFKPRDIVSGDFYWFGTDKRNGQDSIIAACDCTGHGIPGALTSMIGYNILTDINNRGIGDTNRILEELHVGVRNALKQHSNDNRDGMDAALCRYNAKTKTLECSGAKNSVYYIQDNKLTEIKGDVNPIGGIQKEERRIFAKHEISIDRPTSVYLFSDGYPDQFGGEQGRKFMYSKLKELLVQIHTLPMHEQKIVLTETMEKWQHNKHRQIDDMLIIGFEIA